MMGAGLLTPEEGLGLLEFPDISEIVENKNAYIDDITSDVLLNEECEDDTTTIEQ